MATTDTTSIVHGEGLATSPTEDPSLRGAIDLPYTLTAGRAAGTFLAELANRRIVGSRVREGASVHVHVPAQDFCAITGLPAGELVEVPPTGAITGFTETAAGLLATVRLDGTGTDMVHRVLDASYDELEVGARVSARFAAEPQGGVLDLEGFVLDDDAHPGAGVVPLVTETEPLAELKYRMRLEYDHAYGPYYGRMFDELATSRRILGVRCPSCHGVLVPPRAVCDACHVRTEEWVDVQDTGTLKAFSVIHLEFVGQTRKPPYVYAEIVLDGANTRLIHSIGNVDPERAPEELHCGMKVRAVWRDAEPTATLEDIEFFEPVRE